MSADSPRKYSKSDSSASACQQRTRLRVAAESGAISTLPPTLFGPDAPRLGPSDFRRGDAVVWDHPAMGRCVGPVIGVYPLAVVARRQGVERGRPHCLPFGRVLRIVRR